jgi:hypothetical protein
MLRPLDELSGFTQGLGLLVEPTFPTSFFVIPRHSLPYQVFRRVYFDNLRCNLFDELLILVDFSVGCELSFVFTLLKSKKLSQDQVLFL